MDVFIFLVIFNSVVFCNAETLRQLLERAVKNRRHNVLTRRSDFHFDPHESRGIIGAPSYPSHLPEAEPIQPGHTLIRPALGMLKSAVKFPHRELENGAGVNGNINNLGIRYDGKNERVLYTGFRRMPRDYVMVSPSKNRNRKPTFDMSSVVLDLDKEKNTRSRILRVLKKLRKPAKRDLIIYILDPLENDKRPSKHSDESTGESDDNVMSDSDIHDFQPKLYQHKKEVESICHKIEGTEEGNKKKRRMNTQTSIDDNITKRSGTRHGQNITRKYFSNVTHIEDDAIYDDHDLILAATTNAPSEEHEIDELTSGENDKLNWFAKSKHMFDHIKISQDAPDITDLVPEEQENESGRPWWFFNQFDYKPFKD